jgi:hypothetical protein
MTGQIDPKVAKVYPADQQQWAVVVRVQHRPRIRRNPARTFPRPAFASPRPSRRLVRLRE